MDNASATPSSPTPPPPDLPKYIPPQPSLGSPSDTSPTASPPPGDGIKVKIRVAAEPAIDPSPGGAIAPLNPRIIAAAIDLVLALGLLIAAWLLLPGVFGTSIPWLIALAYLVTRDALPFLGGQSVGKKAMHLQAVTLDGQSLAGNWEPGLIRNAVLAIPLFGFVELFVLLTREDKPERGRRLGDEWAKTKVIVANPVAPEEEPFK
ncbi:MAG: RDD family protein [Verrucomicrobia bacterium]|nr:RDD family protein [Verrucomicrobiota bacterium]